MDHLFLNQFKKIIFVFLFLISSISFAEYLPNAKYMTEVEKNWEFLYEKSGIKVYQKKKVDGDSPMAFRAIGIVNAKTIDVLDVLRHVESSAHWDPGLQQKRTIYEYSIYEAIVYNVNKLPWPAQPRDSILHSKLTVDKDNKYIRVKTWSEEHPDYPPFDGLVRGILYQSNFVFKPTADGRTFVDMDAHLDPKGWIPKVIVNYVQKGWVYDFLMNLEKESKTTKLPKIVEFEKALQDIDENSPTLTKIGLNNDQTTDASKLSK